MASGSDVKVQPSEQEKSSRLSPANVVYWSRLGFAVLAGFVYTVLGLGGGGVAAGTLYALGVGIMFYAASVLLVKNVLRYGPSELGGPRKHVSNGMGTYIIWLIFTMTLLNTLLPPAP